MNIVEIEPKRFKAKKVYRPSPSHSFLDWKTEDQRDTSLAQTLSLVGTVLGRLIKLLVPWHTSLYFSFAS